MHFHLTILQVDPTVFLPGFKELLFDTLTTDNLMGLVPVGPYESRWAVPGIIVSMNSGQYSGQGDASIMLLYIACAMTILRHTSPFYNGSFIQVMNAAPLSPPECGIFAEWAIPFLAFTATFTALLLLMCASASIRLYMTRKVRCIP